MAVSPADSGDKGDSSNSSCQTLIHKEKPNVRQNASSLASVLETDFGSYGRDSIVN